ncbi:MAG: LysR family transcriptional regulator [Oscillospiraceae bacterium]|nr:LysR family transcriptional regulator [Oscillospiraceae bacterium]
MDRAHISANLEYYRAFYYVAKYQSITAAARELCLTQPTVTGAIRRLEEQLKVTLFLRHKKGVSLTHEGVILWRSIEPAIRLILSAEQELEQAKALEGGSLRIVSTEMSYRAYILPQLQQFTADHPKVKIRCRNALTEDVLDMVRKGSTDIAILHAPFPDAEDLNFRYISSIDECFVAGERYRFLCEKPRSLAELAEYPMVSTPAGSSTNRFISSLFARYGLSFNPDIEVTTIDLVIQAVENGLGLGTLPESEAFQHIQKGTMYKIPFSDLPMQRKAYVITSKHIPLSPAAQTFMDNYLLRD